MAACARLSAVLVACTALAGCLHPRVEHALDASRLADPRPPRLACAWRVAPVIEGRADTERIGGLSDTGFQVGDAPALVDTLLASHGWSPADSDAPLVRVTLKRLYMTLNRTTKVPVVVYDVAAGDHPAFMVRAQPANSNWAGTENEGQTGYRRAFNAAGASLVERLNTLCASRQGRDAEAS